MKLRYGICLFSLFVLAAGAYYFGYRKLEGQTENLPVESIGLESVGEAAAAPQDILKKNSRYIMEFYDEDTLETETLAMELPAGLIGKNETEVLSYLEEQETSFKEQESGFLKLELVKFSADQLVVKKIYSSLQEQYDFYLTVENGMVVVYKSDKTTFYRYTNIGIDEFPEEEKEEIRKGCYIKDLTELYDLLENATS